MPAILHVAKTTPRLRDLDSRRHSSNQAPLANVSVAERRVQSLKTRSPVQHGKAEVGGWLLLILFANLEMPRRL